MYIGLVLLASYLPAAISTHIVQLDVLYMYMYFVRQTNAVMLGGWPRWMVDLLVSTSDTN